MGLNIEDNKTSVLTAVLKPFDVFQEMESLNDEEPKQSEFKGNEIYNPVEFMDSILKSRQFLTSEPWDRTLNIHSRVIALTKENVICECLLDREKGTFENRGFPRYLFDHIEKIKKGSYILLSIKSKIGSTRIDVINGEKLVDRKHFELKDGWDNLDSDGFNKPLDKPIRL